MSEKYYEKRKLADSNPEWTIKEGLKVAIEFDCPCGDPICRYWLPFGAISTQGAKGWQICGGSDFADISIHPSVHRKGHWHGWITGGNVISCQPPTDETSQKS